MQPPLCTHTHTPAKPPPPPPPTHPTHPEGTLITWNKALAQYQATPLGRAVAATGLSPSAALRLRVSPPTAPPLLASVLARPCACWRLPPLLPALPPPHAPSLCARVGLPALLCVRGRSSWSAPRLNLSCSQTCRWVVGRAQVGGWSGGWVVARQLQCALDGAPPICPSHPSTLSSPAPPPHTHHHHTHTLAPHAPAALLPVRPS